MTQQELVGMDLHETKDVSDYRIMRVIGGWIYRYNTTMAVVFVPLVGFGNDAYILPKKPGGTQE